MEIRKSMKISILAQIKMKKKMFHGLSTFIKNYLK